MPMQGFQDASAQLVANEKASPLPTHPRFSLNAKKAEELLIVEVLDK